MSINAVSGHDHDSAYTAKNSAITGATKTKITYDAKGLVTSGDNATQDDIGDGTTYKQYSATEQSKLSAIEANADVTDAGNVGSSIHGATAKTTMVDADKIAIIDTEASNVLKTLSWAYVKSILKTYFDSIYAAVSHNQSANSITSDTLDGDRLPAMSTSKKGAVPATGEPSGKFLKDDGSWATVLGSGDVVGPASSTDNAIARFDGAGGKTIQNSSVTIDDNGSINIPSGQAYKINGTALAASDVGAIPTSQKAAASGVASLDGSTLVVQNPANATATATASKIPIADGSGKLDTWVSDASDSVKGKVELATAAETNTGTDATRALTPDGLAGSNFGIRYVEILINDSTALTTGDGKAFFRVPAGLNGMNLVSVAAHCGTASSSGIPTFQIANVTDSVDMLSTKLTIDANENDSSTAATAAVIDTSHDDVATGDWLRIDCDVAGTGTAWVVVEMGFQLP